MSAKVWAFIVVDGDLVTPPVRHFDIGTDFSKLSSAALNFMESNFFAEEDDANDREMEAFEANIPRLKDNGGYLMSIGGTICLDVRLVETTMTHSKKSRKAVELSDYDDEQEKRRKQK